MMMNVLSRFSMISKLIYHEPKELALALALSLSLSHIVLSALVMERSRTP